MAIRKQIYTWELHGDGGDGSSLANYPRAGTSHSILWGPYGNIQAGGQTGLVKENEFVVIEKIAATPGISANDFQTTGVAPNVQLTKWRPNMFINLIIDTTNYYQDPQNVWASGVSGTASPYPQLTIDAPYYELWPPVYVLPHQTVDIRYTLYNDIQLSAAAGSWNIIPQSTILAAVYVEYTLYDGTDAMMAQKLLKLGIPVTVATVENYRRLLLEQKGLETDTFQHYLKLMQDENQRQKKQDKIQGIARYTRYGSED